MHKVVKNKNLLNLERQILRFMLAVVLLAVQIFVIPIRMMASCEYKQLMGDANIERDFKFTMALKDTKGVFVKALCSENVQAIVEDGKYVDNDSIQMNFKKGDFVTIKFPKGYKYFDDREFDIYMKITFNEEVKNGKWHCECKTNSNATAGKEYNYLQVHLKDDTPNSENFDYEVWLVDPNTGNEARNIGIIGGSCYMAAKDEGARPWGDTGTVYTNLPESAGPKWNESTDGSKKNDYWYITNSDYDTPEYFIIGHGTDATNHIKGGYFSSKKSGKAELVLGYITTQVQIPGPNGEEIAFDIAEDYPIGEVFAEKLNKPDVEYWIGNQDVTLVDNRGKISKGDKIPKENLQYVIFEKDLQLTAVGSDNELKDNLAPKANNTNNNNESNPALKTNDTDDNNESDPALKTNDTDDNNESDPASKTPAPKTNDTNNVELYATLLIAGIAAVFGILRKRKKY